MSSAVVDKTKLGAGDGIRTAATPANHHKSLNAAKKQRVPVPSSRRFATRCPSPADENSPLETQRQLQEAIVTLSKEESVAQQQEAAPPVTARKVKKTLVISATTPRKRSQTIAEITPHKKGGASAAKRTMRSCVTGTGGGSTPCIQSLSPACQQGECVVDTSTSSRASHHCNRHCLFGDDVATAATTATAKASCEDVAVAARRVYQQLLLNVWRRRRRQVATLLDSSSRYKNQVQQLEMQVNVLQQLRQSESRRRSEAAADSTKLRHELEELQSVCAEERQRYVDLQEEKHSLHGHVNSLNNRVAINQQEIVRLNNNCNTAQRNLDNERDIGIGLGKEKQDLIEQVRILGHSLADEKNKSKDLLGVIKTLQDRINSELKRNEESEEMKTKLELYLKNAQVETSKIKCELTERLLQEEKHSQKQSELRKKLIINNEVKRRLTEENDTLKSTLSQVKDFIRSEQEKPWWKSSGELICKNLQLAAYLLLPALPKLKVTTVDDDGDDDDLSLG